MQASDVSAPPQAKLIPPKRKIKTKAKADDAAPVQPDNGPPLESEKPEANDTSSWTKEQDAQIIKFKADNPSGKWEDLATEMNMAGKGGDLKGRFAELKKEGKTDAPAVNGKKDEPKKDEKKNEKKDDKKDEGKLDKKDEKKEDKKDGNEAGDKKGGKNGKKDGAGDGAGAGKNKGKNDAAKDAAAQFSAAELELLKLEFASAEADKYGWVASRYFDQTGKTVHADVVKAAMG